MKFYIQQIESDIIYDFSFHLIQAIKYNRWYYNDFNIMSYSLADSIRAEKEYIPIGSVNFVINYFKQHFNYDIKPKNIPQRFLTTDNYRFIKRQVINSDQDDIFNDNNIDESLFIKSNTKFKFFTEIVNITDTIPIDNYQISKIINIESEYRCFVYENKLRYISNYSGDFTLFPNVDLIIDMINEYKSEAPIAYTLDVGVNQKDGTFIIEVHDFFSCGLYGFQDYSILPYMFSQWYFNEIKNNNLEWS